MLSNFFSQFLFKFLTGFFGVVFAFMSIPFSVNRQLPEAPDDFTPVVRFAVTSDVHLNGDPEQPAALRLAELLKDSYAYAEGEKYKNLDALAVVGDFATSGSDEEYKLFNGIMEDNLKEGTELICVLGNHEFIKYRDDDASVAYTHYKDLINKDVDRHLVINGYHFVACSYSEDGKTFDSKKEWLTENLDEAVKADPEKPVFVFQHPHPFGTVYGSVNWGDFTVRTVYEKYPQVFDFSGHSHYASSDPRCIWQGAFTAVGTGSLSALMGNLNYISGDEDAPGESGAFWICEADAKGNVRLKLYDIVSHRFFEKNDYYFTDITKKSSHLYNWSNLKSLDTAPEFPEGAEITAQKAENGSTLLRFPNAEGYWGAEDYKITVTAGTAEAFAGTVISNYVRADLKEMSVDIGMIEDGEYTVSITPCSPYAKAGRTLHGTVNIG
ncbi:MAG: metallophosphoesterase [Clostridia bacterium]|nr:metallophosphoesterase [Clostridia bacterium]